MSRVQKSPCCPEEGLSKSQASSELLLQDFNLESSWTTPCAQGRVTTLQPNLLRKYSSPAPQATFLLAGLLPLTQASGEIGDLR